ncbi:hypothetical protein HYW76_05720 [Candidatus Pacearchaeota archaeon]|nr:hypothetical protein [Candidatus Pacearchaeota archaeon]
MSRENIERKSEEGEKIKDKKKSVRKLALAPAVLAVCYLAFLGFLSIDEYSGNRKFFPGYYRSLGVNNPDELKEAVRGKIVKKLRIAGISGEEVRGLKFIWAYPYLNSGEKVSARMISNRLWLRGGVNEDTLQHELSHNFFQNLSDGKKRQLTDLVKIYCSEFDEKYDSLEKKTKMPLRDFYYFYPLAVPSSAIQSLDERRADICSFALYYRFPSSEDEKALLFYSKGRERFDSRFGEFFSQFPKSGEQVRKEDINVFVPGTGRVGNYLKTMWENHKLISFYASNLLEDLFLGKDRIR